MALTFESSIWPMSLWTSKIWGLCIFHLRKKIAMIDIDLIKKNWQYLQQFYRRVTHRISIVKTNYFQKRQIQIKIQIVNSFFYSSSVGLWDFSKIFCLKFSLRFRKMLKKNTNKDYQYQSYWVIFLPKKHSILII
jgi:hypothetical protein